MQKNLFNFEGINWWTMLGGLGFNFIITIFGSMISLYFMANEATAELFERIGAPVMVLFIFLACGFAGFITGKIAGEHQVKHAFWASLGAVVPFVFGAVVFMNPMQFMLAAVAVAGGINGGMLATPRPRYNPPGGPR